MLKLDKGCLKWVLTAWKRHWVSLDCSTVRLLDCLPFKIILIVCETTAPDVSTVLTTWLRVYDKNRPVELGAFTIKMPSIRKSQISCLLWNVLKFSISIHWNLASVRLLWFVSKAYRAYKGVMVLNAPKSIRRFCSESMMTCSESCTHAM